MIYLWNHIIDFDIQNWDYEGVFYEKGSDVLFYFADDDRNIIHCNRYNENGYTESFVFSAESRVWPPDDWKILKNQNILMCSDLVGIDLCRNTLLTEIEKSTVDELWKMFGRSCPPEDHRNGREACVSEKNQNILVSSVLDGIDFSRNTPQSEIKICTVDELFKMFGGSFPPRSPSIQENYQNGRGLCISDYFISLCGECSIRCDLNGKEHWKKRIYGYLYTEIYTYRDRYIFFGTDGCGGRFYEIDMKTGEFCAEINTGGLRQFIIDNDLCYFLNRKTHEINVVSLSDGMIRDTIRLMGKVYEWSRLFLHDNKLYAVSFVKKQGKEYACMNCVSLS